MSSICSASLFRFFTLGTALALAACNHSSGGQRPVGGNGADSGVVADGGASDDAGPSADGAMKPGDGGAPDGAVDPCAGVSCRQPPAAQCVDEHTLRSYAPVGSCSQGTCSYQSSDQACSIGCVDGECRNGDPALDDPARPSLPYECGGDPLTAAQIIEHVPQAEEYVLLQNEKNWNATEHVVRVTRVVRTCTTVTGCSAWASDGNPPLGLPEDYVLYTWVGADGTVSLAQDDVDAAGMRTGRLQASVTTGDFQVILDKAVNGGQPRLYKARYTREADIYSPVSGCFSLASKPIVHPPQTDGSHLEEFRLGVARFDAAVPRVVPAPRPAWNRTCQGTPAGDALIASWFAPGSTTLDARGAYDGRSLTQRCHPITGCTAWTETAATSRGLMGLKLVSPGFAMRLGSTTTLPVVDGVVSMKPYTGAVSADRCAWIESVATDPDGAPSAIVTTSYFQEETGL